jgi:hypothetical protein
MHSHCYIRKRNILGQRYPYAPTIPAAITVVEKAAATQRQRPNQMCGTLLVDQHRLQPATAQAFLNLIRCLMAAGGLVALQQLIDAVGVVWCYTIFVGISLAAVPQSFLEITLGMRWRLARAICLLAFPQQSLESNLVFKPEQGRERSYLTSSLLKRNPFARLQFQQ